MSNYTKFYIHTVTWNIILFFICPGVVIQTFFAECGLSENTIFLINSSMNILQIAILLIASPMIDKSKNVIKSTGLIHLLSIPLALFLLYSCHRQGISRNIGFVIMLSCFVVSQIGVGLYTCISYKLPYHVIDMSKYGRLCGFAGALSYVVTLIMSGALTYIQGEMGYFSATGLMFGFTLLAIGVYTYSTLSFKEFKNIEYTDKKKNEKKINIFKYRPFYSMIVPNLFRGICGGAIGAVVTIGYYCDILDVQSAGMLVMLTSLMSFVGYFVYPFIEKIWGNGKMILIFSVINMITMPLMFSFPSPVLLLVLYAISYFTTIVIGNAVPVGVAKVVDYEVMGQYSGYRMVIHLLGAACFGFVSMFLLETFGATLSMLLIAFLQLLSGIAYYVFFKPIKS